MANAAVTVMHEMGLEVLAVAPSNAAAEGLRKEIGAASAFTPEGLQLAIKNGTIRLGAKSVLYVDEASMLDFAETRHMLIAVRESGARIVFQGDERQLPPVSPRRPALSSALNPLVHNANCFDAQIELGA